MKYVISFLLLASVMFVASTPIPGLGHSGEGPAAAQARQPDPQKVLRAQQFPDKYRFSQLER